MEHQLFVILVLLLSGFFGGVLISMTSGTSWPLILPTLTIILGYSIYPAVGTVLMVDSIIGLAAGSVFIKKKNVDLRATAHIAIPGMITAYLGSMFTKSVEESSLNLYMALLLIVLGLFFALTGLKQNIDLIESKINFGVIRKYKYTTVSIAGALIGFLSGFFGMGSGGNVMFLLVLVIGYSIHQAVGTALITMFFIAGVGAFGHFMDGSILLFEGAIAGSAAALGALSGSIIAHYLNEDHLGRAIGIIVTVLGFFILFRTVF